MNSNYDYCQTLFLIDLVKFYALLYFLFTNQEFSNFNFYLLRINPQSVLLILIFNIPRNQIDYYYLFY